MIAFCYFFQAFPPCYRTCRLVGIEFLLHRRATAFGHAFPGHFTEGIGWLVGGLVGLWRSISVPSTSHFGKVVLKLSKDTKPTVKFQDDPSRNTTELNSMFICIYVHDFVDLAQYFHNIIPWSSMRRLRPLLIVGQTRDCPSGLVSLAVSLQWHQLLDLLMCWFSNHDGKESDHSPVVMGNITERFHCIPDWLLGAVALSAHVNRKAEEVWHPKYATYSAHININ